MQAQCLLWLHTSCAGPAHGDACGYPALAYATQFYDVLGLSLCRKIEFPSRFSRHADAHTAQAAQHAEVLLAAMFVWMCIHACVAAGA